MKRDPLIRQMRKTYLQTAVAKMDKLTAEERRWKRKATIAQTKLAGVRRRINEFAAALAKDTLRKDYGETTMKTIPQFELAGAEEVFNLAPQEAADPWRVDRERWAANQRAAAARDYADKMQRTLAECPGFMACDAPAGESSKGRVVIEPARVPEALPWLKRRFIVAENLELSDGDGLVVEVAPRVRGRGGPRRVKVTFGKVEQFVLPL